MILHTTGRVGAVHIPVAVMFDTDAPDVFTFLFTAKPPVWTIGRDLIADGLMNQVGELDVRVWPSPETDEVAIMLDTPDGRAIIRLEWDPVAAFVRHTYDAVPRGAEYKNVDWNAFPRPVIGGTS